MITNLAIDALATYRLTKLVIDDQVTAELRELAREEIAKIKNDILREKLDYLLGCPWCVSIYAGAFLIALRRISPATADYLSTVLAVSAVTGLLDSHL